MVDIVKVMQVTQEISETTVQTQSYGKVTFTVLAANCTTQNLMAM